MNTKYADPVQETTWDDVKAHLFIVQEKLDKIEDKLDNVYNQTGASLP